MLDMSSGTPEEMRDYLLRDLPISLREKIKVAASLHRKSMKEYLLHVLQSHIDELERRGISLTITTRRK